MQNRKKINALTEFYNKIVQIKIKNLENTFKYDKKKFIKHYEYFEKNSQLIVKCFIFN